jgi:hypothetical protein
MDKKPTLALLFVVAVLGAFPAVSAAHTPDTTISSGPSGSTTDTSPAFAFASTQPGSFQCRLGPAGPSAVVPIPWVACASPSTYVDLAAGSYTFEVRARNGHGGSDPSPARADFVVVPSPPPTPPETTIDSGPSGPIATAAATFAFSSDLPGSFQCRLDAGDWAACASPQEYGDLAEGPHSFEVRADAGGGNVDPTPAVAGFSVVIPVPEVKATIAAGPPDPVAGKTVNLEPVDGTVDLQCPGEDESSRLESFKQVPVGCLINTRQGTVNLTASKGSSGDTQAGHFWGGVFIVTQESGDDQEVVLKLAGRRMCERRKSDPGSLPDRRGRSTTAAVRERSRGGSGRKLWGSGKGNFETSGSYGSATVRGTTWLVVDRCDSSTLIKVGEGTVWARDFVRGKTVVLETGGQYLAKAAIPRLRLDR